MRLKWKYICFEKWWGLPLLSNVQCHCCVELKVVGQYGGKYCRYTICSLAPDDVEVIFHQLLLLFITDALRPMQERNFSN